MARPKKDGTYLNCKIETSVAKDLDKYCQETGLSKTVTVEKALKEYFSEKKSKVRQI